MFPEMSWWPARNVTVQNATMINVRNCSWLKPAGNLSFHTTARDAPPVARLAPIGSLSGRMRDSEPQCCGQRPKELLSSGGLTRHRAIGVQEHAPSLKVKSMCSTESARNQRIPRFKRWQVPFSKNSTESTALRVESVVQNCGSYSTAAG